MRSVAQVMRKPSRYKYSSGPVEWPLPDQLIGIEIEVEGQRRINDGSLFPYWNTTTDGSLQNGIEFVLAQPLSGNNLSSAIHQFFKELSPKRATTSGTHVHIDMMEDDTTVNTVQCLILLAYILETGVYAVADPSREWCGFTNRLTTAPEDFIFSLLRSDLADNDSILASTCGGEHGTGKYYGLNVLTLASYGSVEFRYFPTATSSEELVSWVKLVQSFKKAAMQLGNPASLEAVTATEQSYIEFIIQYFNEWSEVFLKYVPWKVARNNYRKAMTIPQSVIEASQLRCNIKGESILKNKRFARLLKVAKKARKEEIENAELSISILANNDHVPSAYEVPNMFLCYANCWHLAYNASWSAINNLSMQIIEEAAGVPIAILKLKLEQAVLASQYSTTDKALALADLQRRFDSIIGDSSDHTLDIATYMRGTWASDPVSVPVTDPSPRRVRAVVNPRHVWADELMPPMPPDETPELDENGDYI